MNHEMNCDNCAFQYKCPLLSLSLGYRRLFCNHLREPEKVNEQSIPWHLSPDPAITRFASYTEMLDLAFSPGTDDKLSRKAISALIKAKKRKRGDITKFIFQVPVFPSKGSIKIKAA